MPCDMIRAIGGAEVSADPRSHLFRARCISFWTVREELQGPHLSFGLQGAKTATLVTHRLDWVYRLQIAPAHDEQGGFPLQTGRTWDRGGWYGWMK